MGPHHSRKKLPPSPLRSTRVDPRDLHSSTLALRFPATATSTEVITIGEERLGERIWIGGTSHGVEVTRHLRFFALDGAALRPALFAALRALDGSRSVHELATSLAIPLADLSRLLLYLESEGLIHFHSERLASPRTRPELSRREIERAHLPRGSSFHKRSRQSIAIISEELTSTTSHTISPTAIAVASLLFGSGFQRITFLVPEQLLREGGSKVEQISDRDLGLSIFNGSDIGLTKIDRLEEVAHRSAILPREEAGPLVSEEFNATLTISMGYPRPDHHQRWLSEDRAFLIVPGYSQGEVRIGPIVIPGKTPCLRCYELNQVENDFWREQSRQLQLLQPIIDPPHAASHLVASLTALYATAWLDGLPDPIENPRDGICSNHLLLGQQLIHQLNQAPYQETQSVGLARVHVDPISPGPISPGPVRIERWHNHPECGCHWLPNFHASTTKHAHPHGQA